MFFERCQAYAVYSQFGNILGTQKQLANFLYLNTKAYSDQK